MKLSALVSVLLCSFLLFGQKEPVSETLITSDATSITKKDSVKKHSALKAALFSVALPGAGQVYNHIAMPKGQKKAYWKVPLIYAGLGATTYFAITNHQKQKSIKEEYKFREASDFTAINDPDWAQYSNSSLVEMYHTYANNRNWLIIGAGIVYLLQVADAAVEAHFVKFDISEDLSLQLRPKYLQNPYNQGTTIGVTVALKFR